MVGLALSRVVGVKCDLCEQSKPMKVRLRDWTFGFYCWREIDEFECEFGSELNWFLLSVSSLLRIEALEEEGVFPHWRDRTGCVGTQSSVSWNLGSPHPFPRRVQLGRPVYREILSPYLGRTLTSALWAVGRWLRVWTGAHWAALPSCSLDRIEISIKAPLGSLFSSYVERKLENSQNL